MRLVLLSGVSALLSPLAARVRVARYSSDAVTGTKFEEEDSTKNPERRPGHQVKGMEAVDEETMKRQAAIRAHQEQCPRLSWAEEIRTMTAQKAGFAVLSTVAQKEGIEGFPSGSVVGFAVDDAGRPIFSFSGMSSHTKNLDKDPRCSLTVTEKNFQGAADARVVLAGEVKRVADDVAVREIYKESHPGAYWVDFGDFHMYRMDPILDVSFVGGFARAGTVTPDDYANARVDPLVEAFDPVATHMNDDHEDALKTYLEVLVGTAPVARAQMKRLDRFGFDVRVTDQASGATGVLRVPFEEPVTERKQVKDAIVALSKKAKAIQDQEEDK
ncbi:hypothetical protein CTAYLR_009286 [Chrysophaeum taylorii]|uniref:DUF2470 domain-containing protein n=1 Tax=Chrysophaeum taylorii TaxID=2483200 RepID=A0AAD7XSD5_9STRA|nr:hypothetical protein CTAYLR_009286 [Chrysophaeum taylorii]